MSAVLRDSIRRTLTLGIALAAVSCAATPTRFQVLSPAPGWPDEPNPASFPGAADIIAGFSPVDDESWHYGDAALLGLEWTTSDGTDRLLLEIRVVNPRCMEHSPTGPQPSIKEVELDVQGSTWSMQSELAALSVRVRDPSGAVLGESVVRVPLEALDHGFAEACMHAESTGEGVRTGHPVEPVYLEAVTSLLALFGIIEKDPLLADIFWNVVRTPSAWSVVTHFGVSVSLTPYFSRCTRVADRPLHLPQDAPAWAVPILIEVNDSAALWADLLVTDPCPPLHLCGGIVGMRAQHPEDPNLSFRMILLAARAHAPGESAPPAAVSTRFPHDPELLRDPKLPGIPRQR